MQPVRKVLLAFVVLFGLVFYIAAFVMAEPPLWTHLYARDVATVERAQIQTRTGEAPARPLIDVRTANGALQALEGYGWTDMQDAQATLARHALGTKVSVRHWQGRLWRGLQGAGEWGTAALGVISLFFSLFGLWMMWKLRRS